MDSGLTPLGVCKIPIACREKLVKSHRRIDAASPPVGSRLRVKCDGMVALVFELAGTDESSDPAALFEQMKSMDIIDRGAGDYECVPKGHSKATAMDLVLKHYNLPLEAAWVFGDSSNDLAMFEFAQNSVAMGEHSPVLDPYATFVTKTVEEDGIAWALEKLGIIE